MAIRPCMNPQVLCERRVMAAFPRVACRVACPPHCRSLCFVLAACVGDHPLGLSVSHLGGLGGAPLGAEL